MHTRSLWKAAMQTPWSCSPTVPTREPSCGSTSGSGARQRQGLGDRRPKVKVAAGFPHGVGLGSENVAGPADEAVEEGLPERDRIVVRDAERAQLPIGGAGDPKRMLGLS